MKAQSSKTEKKIAVHTRERAKNLASFNRLEKELDRLKGKWEAHDNAIEALRTDWQTHHLDPKNSEMCVIGGR